MSAAQLPAHDAVQQAAARLAMGVDAAELHGSLCGYLCGGGWPSARDWPQRLSLDALGEADLDARQPIGRLFAATCAQLDDDTFGLRLLLDDGSDGEAHALSLFGWCRGFLGGYGLAGGEAPSEEAAEALEDLGRLAAATPGFDDPDEDAAALEELIEFVRVAVMLLYGERRPRPH